MHDTAAAVTTPDPLVHLNRKTIERVDNLRKRVSETTVTLDRAAREHKEAKSAHESALTNLSTAVSDMLDEANGVVRFPLFANQSEAIASAQADPIAQKLLTRLIDHGVTNVNQLIVAGYSEDQRNLLAAYLDALDARKKAESEGQAELPELIDMPAFLIADSTAPVFTPEEIEGLTARIVAEGLTLKPEHLAALDAIHWEAVQMWLHNCDVIKAQMGEALTVDHLPSAPSCLVNPAEVLPEPEPKPEPVTILDEPEKKARAPRRSSKEFKNSPRIAKPKGKKKGGR